MIKRFRSCFVKENGGFALLRFVLFCLGALFLVWFLLPIPVFGVLGVGNGTGILASMALTAAALLWPRFAARGREKAWIGRIMTACCVLAGAAALAAAAMGVNMIAAAARRPTHPVGPETAVVLGCQVIGTSPSRMLSRRIAAAKAYLDENPEAACVLSGGQGEDEGCSEAECMYNALTEQGIDPARLYIEDRSTSTAENIAFSWEIMRENGLNPYAAIVTDGYHQARAQKLMLEIGDKKPHAVNAKTPLLLFPGNVVREMIATVYHWAFG